MGTLLEDYHLRYTDSGLKVKTTTAIARAAQAVLSEDEQTANHANRLVWAKRVLAAETTIEAEKFLWPIIGLCTITGQSSDQDIFWAVNQFINLFATGS